MKITILPRSALFALLGGFWVTTMSADPGIVEMHDVEIGKAGDRVLHADIAMPEKPPASPVPALIWIHGGGWKAGSYHENPGKPLAAEGYFTASVEYRFSNEAKWPAQLEDCRQALRWVKANASRYHVDPNRIAVWGSSAGGHLASCLGTMGDGDGGTVQAVIDFCGPVDFTVAKKSEKSAGLVSLLLDDPQLTDLEKQKSASPLFYVKPGLPPFLLIHGEMDPTVPCEVSVRFHAALTKAGVKNELLLVPGADHGFRGVKGAPTPQPDHPTRMEKVRAFLKEAMP